MKTIHSVRLKIKVEGIVQGVGFRPYIFKLASKHNLTGFVMNTSGGVEIEVEGDEQSVNNFLSELPSNAPSMSEIKEIDYEEITPKNSDGFLIKHSYESSDKKTLISPDIAICDDCLQELFNPEDRRYLYPFINCTNCGPRLTIIEDIPYDRKYTTMSKFGMCEKCEEEYNNPLNRRFHAQPNACPDCGPQVWLEKNSTPKDGRTENVFEEAADLLLNGKIVAIKGLGGFHLAANALNDKAVKRLRDRKGREAKPFALMVDSIETVKKLVEVSQAEEKILQSPERPILLLKKKNGATIAESVAPGNTRLGIMLPYTPMHYILFNSLKEKSTNGTSPVLVMTSANYSEEPICITNKEARERLSKIADAFIMHNRDILIRADDSVAMVVNDKTNIFRRSRGFVPKPVVLKEKNPPVLALGAELKNTICLLKDENAFVSQHIGDLTNYYAYQFFTETIEHIQKIIFQKAEYIAYDLHPDYLSTRWAKNESRLSNFGIQHHHAHMASCMAENGIDKPVIGLILDGTGYGYDKTIWGGEIFIGDFTNLRRFAHLEPLPLPGGDIGAKEPWRIAVGYLYKSFGNKMPEWETEDKKHKELILEMLDKDINSPLTSSTGRLFDAVSAMSGGPQIIRYEAEAAISLMHEVDAGIKGIYDYDEFDKSYATYIPLKRLIRSLYNDVANEERYSVIAAKFHNTLAKHLSEAVWSASLSSGIKDVVLSGGVFQNDVLLKLISNHLKSFGLKIHTHSTVPANDGGISLGQAAIASKLILNNLYEVKYESA